MKKFLKLLTSKATIIGLITLIQFAVFGLVILYLEGKVPYFFYTSHALSFILILFILKSDEPTTYKLSWIIPLVVVPVFGGFFYLTFKPLSLTRRLKKKAAHGETLRINHLKKALNGVPDIDLSYKKQIEFLQTFGWPAYDQTNIKFLASGEEKLTFVIEELKKAEKFIFLEYFILEETGIIWASILPILKEKAKAGVDVRLIYDDFGSSARLKRGFKKRMEQLGIKVVVFNPLKIRFVVAHNYRDHRKIIIIDGHTGFTGGINIADEYINVKKRFGHWHDAAIMLKGDSVYSLTASFLEVWDFHMKTETDYHLFKSDKTKESDGIIIPFSDSPFNKHFISIKLYTQMIFSAKKEIFITSPYFIVDQQLLSALMLQASSGVKVYIMIPSIPDKNFAYIVTKYNLKQLASVPNIHIYSYTPGFIHSKILYIDDEVASIGTVNFDFRSFYLHFENTVWIYNNSSLKDIKMFLNSTIESSSLLTYNDLNNRNIFYKLYETILVFFSHLL